MTESKPFEIISNQLKYYFGDFNLSRDKFMQQESGKDDGWIPLTVMLTFKKLAAITKEPSDVIEAIKTYGDGFIEFDAIGSKIRRSPAFPLPDKVDEYKMKTLARTLHIKGFPLESSFDQLWSFLSTYGPLESLLMRKTRKGAFKGCCLAVFKDESDAVKVMEKDLALQYNGKDLMKEKEETHLTRRKEFFERKKKKPRGVKRSADDENEEIKPQLKKGKEEPKEHLKEEPKEDTKVEPKEELKEVTIKQE